MLGGRVPTIARGAERVASAAGVVRLGAACLLQLLLSVDWLLGLWLQVY